MTIQQKGRLLNHAAGESDEATAILYEIMKACVVFPNRANSATVTRCL